VSSEYCCLGTKKEEAREAIGDGEKEGTEIGILGNTSGEMSRHRRVVTNDRLGAINKIAVSKIDCFTYLCSQIHSSDCSTTMIFRRIAIAWSVIGRLTDVWWQLRPRVGSALFFRLF